MRLSKYLRAAACGLLLSVPLSSAKAAGGWQFQTPPVVVTATTTHRSNIFYIGQPISFSLQGSGATTYQVRDYWGNIVDQGSVDTNIAVNVSAPGWYKLYLYGTTAVASYGTAVGGTTFVILRDDPHFPALPDKSLAYGYGLGPKNDFAADAPTRGVLRMGPTRHYFFPSQASQFVPGKLDDISMAQQFYQANPDPVRPRDLMMNLGTNATSASDLAGVTTIAKMYQNSVRYWEGRNEPNNGTIAANYASEAKLYYQAIKAANSSLKVMGPSTVDVNPRSLAWLNDFFKAGGGDTFDAFSFHSYNMTNGDLALARTSFQGLNALLAQYGQDKKERWQTEQGFNAAEYGLYAPRHQGRWTMLQAMVFEQESISKEHNSYWYDKSHGFWDAPVFWENDDNSLNPAAPLMRVFGEELYGTKFTQSYDFGDPGNKMFLGSLFQGPQKSVAAFMSAGGTDGKITLQVKGGSSLHLVSAFGVESDLPVTNGQVVLPVPEIPVYVEMAAGQTIQVVPLSWGQNLALQPGVTAEASGYTPHPYSPSDTNDIGKLFNGKLDTWYYDFNAVNAPWSSNVSNIGQTDAWVQLNLAVPQQISRVVIYCPVPWQSQGSLLDYELQYDNNGQWVTIDHTTEPTNSLPFYTPTLRCTVDTFYSDRCIFTHEFPTVTTGKIRVLVHDCTYGGAANQEVYNAGGQPGGHQITIREIEVYSPLFDSSQSRTIQGSIKDSQKKGIVGATVSLSGWQTKTATTGPGGTYSFSGLTQGAGYTVTPMKSNYAMAARSLTFNHLVGSQNGNFTASTIPASSGTGLRGEYFDTGYDWKSVFLPAYYKTSRTDATINTGDNWRLMSKPAGIGSERFAVRWTGLIEPKYSEDYTFTVDADDGVRLWVNDQLLIDDWKQANYSTAHPLGKIRLFAGQRVNIRMEYFQQGGFATCNLSWSSPSQKMQIVPQSQLYPSVVNAPPIIGLTMPADAVPDPNTGALTLSASATDPDGKVKQVRFIVNDKGVGGSTTQPFTMQWTPPQSGNYVVTATATDNMGAMTVSDPVLMTVGAEVQVKGMIQLKQKHHPAKVMKKPAVKNHGIKKPAAKKPVKAIKKPMVKKPAAKKLH